jgi:very-short-patch-repair endonuclease
LGKIKEASEIILKAQIASSKLQNEVFKILGTIAPESRRKEILYHHIVDCYIPNKKLVIEVNGPGHYIAGGNLNVSTQQKQASLEKLGYKVINIGYRSWKDLSSDNDKIGFFNQLLDSVPDSDKIVSTSLRKDAKPFMPSFAVMQSLSKPNNAANLKATKSMTYNYSV